MTKNILFLFIAFFYSISAAQKDFIPLTEGSQLRKDYKTFIIKNNNSQLKNKLISIHRSKFFQNIFRPASIFCTVAAVGANIYCSSVSNSPLPKSLVAFIMLSGLGMLATERLCSLETDNRLQGIQKNSVNYWLGRDGNSAFLKKLFTNNEEEIIKEDIKGNPNLKNFLILNIDKNYNNKNINEIIKKNLNTLFETANE